MQRLQRAGLSLARIGELAGLTPAARRSLIEAERSELRSRIAVLERTERFLAHTLQCTHPIVAECPDCAAFVGSDPGPAAGDQISS